MLLHLYFFDIVDYINGTMFLDKCRPTLFELLTPLTPWLFTIPLALAGLLLFDAFSFPHPHLDLVPSWPPQLPFANNVALKNEWLGPDRGAVAHRLRGVLSNTMRHTTKFDFRDLRMSEKKL